ncbi:MAG: transglutaminase domain-containing protein [Desulfatitalea sp.]|nr:transglutaminase domain-containing protein [Desulfatitalea sp.]
MSLLQRKIAVLMLVTFVVLSAAAVLTLVLKSGAPPPPVRIHLSYSVTIQNMTNQLLRNASVRVGVPAEETPFQQRAQIRSDHTFQLPANPLDHPPSDTETLLFEWELFPPFATKIVTIRSAIDLWEISRQQGDEDLTPYLVPEPFIESDNPLIMGLAATLKEDDPLRTVGNTFQWVSEKLHYIGYVKRTRGALYALEHLRGDCTEFAFLFVALCRANGIPARAVGGFVCPQSAVLDLGDYHNWAEFHHDGRWHVADPQRNRLMNDQHQYVVFHYLRPSEGLHEIPFVAVSEAGPLVARTKR